MAFFSPQRAEDAEEIHEGFLRVLCIVRGEHIIMRKLRP
jgi:hypothetical protein